MLKKVLKIIGGLAAVIILLIIAASVAVIILVDKNLVETQMEKALHRNVQIEDISVGIFSVVSGIEVKGVTISNYRSAQRLAAVKNKPVAKNDVFVGLDTLKLKLKFMPLLKKRFELKELVLYKPKINIVKGKGGGFNFDDLLKPKKLTPEERAKLAKEKAEEAKKPNKPLTADDIPVAISIGEIGIKNGTITLHDRQLNQTFQIYALTALVHSISIDPKDLAHKDRVKVKIYMGIKNIGPVRSGSVQSFNITFNINGTVRPFDLKTRKLDPEISLRAGSPDGQITGLQIFNAVTKNKKLKSYFGKHLAFLKGKQEWKGSDQAYVNIWYKHGTAKLTNGKVNAKELNVLFDGSTNINTKSLNVNLQLELRKKRNSAIAVGLRKQVESGLKKLGIDKYVKADKIAKTMLKPFLNERGMIYMKMKVTGTMSKPQTIIVHPEIKKMDQVLKSMTNDVLKEAAKDAAQKAIKDGAKKLLKKKNLKKIIKKIKIPKLW